jgi:hypothetical protein
MKKNYAKIDRATGKVLKQKSSEGMERVFNKPTVWIEVIQKEPIPAYDTETHKIVKTVDQPDLSNLSIDVSHDAQRVLGYDVVALNSEELQVVADTKINKMVRELSSIIELLFTKIAITNDGVAFSRTDFPDEVWDKINAIRTIRGESGV